ncbi:hypothetical protein [Pseudovibrio brasiliensis]|uniref:hypothetical protein n=1 Tax=Pseudovibrio brasiliensis TaxID=1898042 RepID=UPI0009FB167C
MLLPVSIEANVDGTRVHLIAGGDNQETRILITGNNIEIKLETSPVMRGTVNPHEVRMVTEAVKEQFSFVEMQVPPLKICLLVGFVLLWIGNTCGTYLMLSYYWNMRAFPMSCSVLSLYCEKNSSLSLSH